MRQSGSKIREIDVIRVGDLPNIGRENKIGQSKTKTQTKKMNIFNFSKRERIPVPSNYRVTGETIPLKHIWTDTDGTKWFEYINPMSIPAKRAIAAEVATRFAEMNMTSDSLKLFIESMKQSANKGNIVELFHLLSEIEFRLEYIGEENTMIELAACYFVIDGENETEFSDVFKQKKIEKIRIDGRSKDFFIQKAFALTTKYSEMSETDILDYLTANVPANQRFQQILHRLKSGDTLTK